MRETMTEILAERMTENCGWNDRARVTVNRENDRENNEKNDYGIDLQAQR